MRTIIIQPDNHIILVGSFTNYNGQICNRIVRLNLNGSLDPSFNVGTGADEWVWTIALQEDEKF